MGGDGNRAGDLVASQDVLPRLPLNDVQHHLLAHAVGASDSDQSGPTISRSTDVNNGGLCQSGVRVRLTAQALSAANRASFTHHVCRVISSRSKKQVRRVHADAVVALVQHAQVASAPVRQLPRQAVRVELFCGHAEKPAVAIGSGARPHPAGAKLGHVRRHRPVLLDLLPKPSYRFLIQEPTPRGSGPGRVAATRGFFQG